jgi:hypothetical protein
LPLRPPSYGYELCAACVGKRALERIQDLLKEVAPGGEYERNGRDYRCDSFTGGAGRGLLITISNGLWHDFRSGEGDDLINFVGRGLGGGNSEGLSFLRRWLGQPERQRLVHKKAAPSPVDDRRTYEAAVRIWRESATLRPGDMGWRYLDETRAIELERWARANNGKVPACLRFNPRVWNREVGRHLPALVAAIVGRDGKFQAVHRTWLEEKNGCVIKGSFLEEQKMTLGRYVVEGGAGCIRLWRPNWSEATDGDVLGLSEGIENAMSVAKFNFGKPHVRIAAGVSLSALLKTWVPSVFSSIILIADNDAPEKPAVKLFEKVCDRFNRECRDVRVLRATRQVKDVNEYIQRLPRGRDGVAPSDADALGDFPPLR